jgi:hypothetical protein
MAAIETLKANRLTFGGGDEPRDLTTPRTLAPEAHPGEFRRRFERWGQQATIPEVEPEERGKEDLQDQARFSTAEVEAVGRADAYDQDGESARLRSELARDVLDRMERIIPLVGDVALPTNIELLKRDLSRCHDQLRNRPAESGFLSIVTLMESALTQRKWREFTREQFQRMRSAIEVGYLQSRVTFDDYERVRREVADDDIDATPRISLESLNSDDVQDDEET